MSPTEMSALRQKARVVDEPREKVLEALGGAVGAAREDLRHYRNVFPAFAAQSSARGMASWIHDRLWHHSCRLLDAVDGAVCYEKGPCPGGDCA